MRIFILLLAFSSPTFAQTYDFWAAAEGVGAGGGMNGSFDYFSGAISNFTWGNTTWLQQSQGNDLSFINANGDVLTTTLYNSLGDATATATDFLVSFGGGGYYGYCGGRSGLCDQGPITFTSVNAQVNTLAREAPELSASGILGALTLLFGCLAVMRGSVAFRRPNNGAIAGNLNVPVHLG